MRRSLQVWLPIILVCLAKGIAGAQALGVGGFGIGPTGPGGNRTTAQGGGAFRVQCPTNTPLRPTAISNSAPGTPFTEAAEPAYTAPAVTADTVGARTLSQTLTVG